MRNSDELRAEDFSLFLSVESLRYLQKKEMPCFSSLAESDMILSLFTEYWLEICEMDILDRLTLSQKIEFFKNYPLVFPLSF